MSMSLELKQNKQVIMGKEVTLGEKFQREYAREEKLQKVEQKIYRMRMRDVKFRAIPLQEIQDLHDEEIWRM